jgi:Fe-S cluster biosynthesis and repair protein YggX
MTDDTARRIEQFRQMTEADPGNELGHFSLGRAYLEAEQPAQAAVSLARAIEINANLGRAYELLGEAQLRLAKKEEAIATITRGVQVAHLRGERLAVDAMVKRLGELGAAVPQLAEKQAAPLGENEILCSRCGKAGARLARPPFRNAQGQMIQERICQECWRQWLEMGTKVINELRLPMHEPEGQRTYERHMVEFLSLPTQ